MRLSVCESGIGDSGVCESGDRDSSDCESSDRDSGVTEGNVRDSRHCGVSETIVYYFSVRAFSACNGSVCESGVRDGSICESGLPDGHYCESHVLIENGSNSEFSVRECGVSTVQRLQL